MVSFRVLLPWTPLPAARLPRHPGPVRDIGKKEAQLSVELLVDPAKGRPDVVFGRLALRLRAVYGLWS